MKNLIACLSLAVFCLLSTTTFSQTTFTGANSTDWADAGNWDDGLPAAGNDATIPTGLTDDVTPSLIVDFNLENFGVITNHGTIDNYGTITNSGTITNDGIINGDPVIEE